MKYCKHSEYPVILNFNEKGVMGTWYKNQMKERGIVHQELRDLGKGEEVDKVVAFLEKKGDGFKERLEAFHMTMTIAHSLKTYNPFEVVKLVGQVLFEPLVSVNYHVLGRTIIEFEIEDPKTSEVSRYYVQLNGPVVTRLAKAVDDRWSRVDEIFIPYNTDMHEKFEGHGSVIVPM